MTPNPDKIEEAVLALLHPTSFLDKHGGVTATRAWKSHDWDALDRLHQKGLISDPKVKANPCCYPRKARGKRKPCFTACSAIRKAAFFSTP